MFITVVVINKCLAKVNSAKQYAHPVSTLAINNLMPYTEDDAIISYQIRNDSINSLEFAISHISFTNQTYSGFFITIVNSYNVV